MLTVARLAGFMGARRTAEPIPLGHTVPLDAVEVDLVPVLADAELIITANMVCSGRTGVEMEALTAATVVALMVYDLLNSLSHDLVIARTGLLTKSVGRSDEIRRC